MHYLVSQFSTNAKFQMLSLYSCLLDKYLVMQHFFHVQVQPSTFMPGKSVCLTNMAYIIIVCVLSTFSVFSSSQYCKHHYFRLQFISETFVKVKVT